MVANAFNRKFRMTLGKPHPAVQAFEASRIIFSGEKFPLRWRLHGSYKRRDFNGWH